MDTRTYAHAAYFAVGLAPTTASAFQVQHRGKPCRRGLGVLVADTNGSAHDPAGIAAFRLISRLLALRSSACSR